MEMTTKKEKYNEREFMYSETSPNGHLPIADTSQQSERVFENDNSFITFQ